jgi:hypothetical protein
VPQVAKGMNLKFVVLSSLALSCVYQIYTYMTQHFFWGQFLPFGKIFFEKKFHIEYYIYFKINLPKLEKFLKDHHVSTHL